MSQQNPPVPAPRRKINLPSLSMDDELLSYSATPQFQRYSRDSSAPRVLPRSLSTQNDRQLKICLGDSTPPPVSPRTWSRQNAALYETIHDIEEYKVDDEVKLQPPPLPTRTPKNQLSPTTETQYLQFTSIVPPTTALKLCYKQAVCDQDVSFQGMTRMEPRDNFKSPIVAWSDISRELKLKGSPETQTITSKAEQLYKAIQVYMQLMSANGQKLEDLIMELQGIADNLDKVSKGTKIAGITGGASSVAGGVAAAAGVILAPFTAGASLALTVVGAGVAAAGGVTGASAAIANKANLNQDTKKINKLLQEFKDSYEKILTSLRFINEGMDQLKHHGLSVLKEKLDNNMIQSRNAASAVQLAIGEDSATVPERSASASGVLDGFALGMDIYFTKDGQKVKKGLESKLAKKLRKLAEQFDLGLTELKRMKEVFIKHA